MDFETRIVTPAEWPLIEGVMLDAFGNGLPPSARQGTFLATMAGMRLAAFVHVEELLHAHCLYVAPEFRANSARLALNLLRDADARMPAGNSALVLSDSPRIDRWMPRLGARDLGQWRAWRKDYR